MNNSPAFKKMSPEIKEELNACLPRLSLINLPAYREFRSRLKDRRALQAFAKAPYIVQFHFHISPGKSHQI